MAVTLEAIIDPVQLARIMKLVRPGVIPRLAASAVNDAGRWGETRVNRAIRDEINLKGADVKKVIKRSKATRTNLRSTITVKREAISLKRYQPRQTKRGVTVKVRKQRPRELVKSAFIVKEIGDHVFKRRGKARLPIDRQQGPTAVGVLAGVPGLLDSLSGQINQKLSERLDSKVKAHLEGKLYPDKA